MHTYPIAQDSFHLLPQQAVSDYLSYLFEKSSSAQQRMVSAIKKTELILQPLLQAGRKGFVGLREAALTLDLNADQRKHKRRLKFVLNTPVPAAATYSLICWRLSRM